MSQSICEEQTYNEIFRQQSVELRNYLYYKCGDLNQAEDLVQDTFIKLWKKCAEVVFETVVGFIYTIANRMFIDLTRSKKVALKFEKQQVEQKADDPYFILRTNEFREKIESVISELPDGQREAFLLNRIDKLTYKEIAERLEISEKAVEKRMTKALIKLKDKVEELKHYKI